jgi:serine/threonine protein kinase
VGAHQLHLAAHVVGLAVDVGHRAVGGPAYLSDFGTAWAPDLSSQSEPPDNKILDIGTGPYRAPEVLFGYREYGPPVDMWAAGVMLAEAATVPPTPIFESRAVHEDGNQLGLILSIFKTLGTPNKEIWPEAADFKVNPFELWTVFPQRSWVNILPGIDSGIRDLVAKLIRFDGQRLTAEKVRFCTD